jgi:hypothetical protein
LVEIPSVQQNIFMKKYSSIKGYLERFSLFNIGKLKVRWHRILSADGTPYFHNHPFAYISIVCKGGYVEQRLVGDSIIEIQHKVGSVIVRKPCDFHRIKEAKNCRTLFFAWDTKTKWTLKKSSFLNINLKTPKLAGIYIRNINGKRLYCKFDDFWYLGSLDKKTAECETRLSIHQVQDWE